jgi:hypothetical protein
MEDALLYLTSKDDIFCSWPNQYKWDIPHDTTPLTGSNGPVLHAFLQQWYEISPHKMETPNQTVIKWNWKSKNTVTSQQQNSVNPAHTGLHSCQIFQINRSYLRWPKFLQIIFRYCSSTWAVNLLREVFQRVRRHHNDWRTDTLGSLLKHIPKICLLCWQRFFPGKKQNF